ncbi:biotin synthase, putative [Aduncisulcus paluster]|uniref:Biotin synthase, putative n=1 Tax=Aduncisulcus paluster TaxID=2918883 RepID=A0ABQ5KBV8_9EUKA|nr:biotin synthase, putative [Aduncisulcus paluster]
MSIVVKINKIQLPIHVSQIIPESLVSGVSHSFSQSTPTGITIPGPVTIEGMKRPLKRAWKHPGTFWSIEKDPHPETVHPKDIIDEERISRALVSTELASTDVDTVKRILKKAKDAAQFKIPVGCQFGSEFIQGLSIEETALLLNIDEEEHPELMEELYKTAKFIKEKIYGKRVVMALVSTELASTDVDTVKRILKKAKDAAQFKIPVGCQFGSEFIQGLSIEETALLLNIDEEEHPELMEELYKTAKFIKEKIYGKRVVMFAPLYTANECINGCLYCGFSCHNKDSPRTVLDSSQVAADARAIVKQGHKRTLMLCGESPKYPFDSFVDAMVATNAVRDEKGSSIRRINVEVPTLSVSDMKRLKATDSIGTVALFQESYHRPTFAKVHSSGPKADYDFRITNMDRSNKGGIDDVGLGVLYGLYDYKWDTLAMIMHGAHLDKNWGTGPHTVSVPRIQPAKDAPLSHVVPYPVNDKQFKKIVAVLRSEAMRDELLQLGVSQLSAASRTDPGAYSKGEEEKEVQTKVGTTEDEGQFELSDHRSLDEVVRDLMKKGFIPSFCTGCYRSGRTGEVFMNFAKSGAIGNYCQPNALLTLAEYLIDYASPETQKIGWELIGKEMENIPSESRKKSFMKKLDMIKIKGVRDLYF